MEFIDLTKFEKEPINNHTSKGNQPKWHIGDNWYKADHMGYEALSEYVVSYLAIQYLGAVTVPLDKSLGLAAMEQICEQTQVRLCLTNERQRPAQVPFLSLKEITI